MGAAVLGLGLASAAQPLQAASASGAIAAAVSDPARPQEDRARDADRKPAEVIALTGLHAGNKVAEMLPGGGYFTRILSKVVGPGGTVYAWVPAPPPNAPAGRDMAAPMRALAADANYANIKVAALDPATPLPEAVDLVWTSLNYHDLHNRPNADLGPTNKMAFDALKPGGLYLVIDHAAEAGSGKRDTRTLHRIDPELVKAEVQAAGFRLVSENNVLRHPSDDRKQSSHQVERGKTDQFTLLFQKPSG